MISVIIPTYNRFDLLLNAIESVENQTYKNLEIIVIDDCSSDKRYSELIQNPNIIYIKLNQRVGLPSKVRNIGINYAKGEWIAFLDDDDEWLPNKLEKQLEFSKKYNFICSDAIVNEVPFRLHYEKHIWDKNNPLNTQELNYEIIIKHNLIINSSVLIKKELLDKIGGIPEDRSFRGIEDYETWKRILAKEPHCFFVKETLLKYNMNSQKFYKDNYI